jgi:circadian clock protein KaiC
MKNINEISKLETGIIGLDDITLGGLPEHRATLLAGTSGSCKTLLTLQFLAVGIMKYNQPAVFVTFEEPVSDIKRNVKSLGWDLDDFEKKGKLAFVDVSPEPDQQNIETGLYDFTGLLVRIEHAVKKVGAKRVGIDSISASFSQFSENGIVRRELFRIAAGLKLLGVTTIISVERTQEYGEIARFGVEEFVADNVIILRNSLEEEKRRRTVEVLKLRGAPHQKGEFPCTISENGMEILPLSSL